MVRAGHTVVCASWRPDLPDADGDAPHWSTDKIMAPGSRPPPAAQRLPSQRATAEFRGVESDGAPPELQRQLKQRDEDLVQVRAECRSAEKKQRELETEVCKLHGQAGGALFVVVLAPAFGRTQRWPLDFLWIFSPSFLVKPAG